MHGASSVAGTANMEPRLRPRLLMYPHLNTLHRRRPQALFTGPSKFKYEPFEWVYDGLSPLLLPHVLARRKGAPLALALATAAAARRLGVPARLICAHDGEVLTTAQGEAAPGGGRVGLGARPPSRKRHHELCPRHPLLHAGPAHPPAGPALMQSLPPEVAARQAGRTVAAPPSPNTWLVGVAGCAGGRGRRHAGASAARTCCAIEGGP
jgi:hypothetical protein